MKRISALLVASLFVFGAMACGSSNEDKAEKVVKVMEGMADIADKNKDNCDKMAEELNKYLDSNKKVFEEAKGMKSSPEEEKKMQEKYGKRMETAMGKMMGPMMSCPKAAEAMGKINL